LSDHPSSSHPKNDDDKNFFEASVYSRVFWQLKSVMKRFLKSHSKFETAFFGVTDGDAFHVTNVSFCRDIFDSCNVA